ncbi:MAG: hypothetical protein COS39_06190 [Hydrogenophilales bacterium CG03_land_8_20_14_0_80_62_28]|nr:hypothetical protein [Betaproteobacteria bacterium]OIO78502.1 MAG: hypothetical protein AUJ86_05735 [Hydrogenophilaceae bacterium CG1_02_62_390]PIV22845.1 MAG: hypothetical protein COS39_06190 [Hydrogenophilales bacterium CG03_land_8_20_14_0_80_62_28]PIW37896.1 MAG: hypothetical protein COW23_08855 [Hydrogenophilales bacterium CG15_BIG_FIL_POST_REV_8_21_14_020_62_31]PIW71472.1 MAG: hypothetical protein COW07_07965 [Hydrogenophilales bacterium CG12_big_fil_rev_8_21_14_0_65_61_21]PIX01977.1 M
MAINPQQGDAYANLGALYLQAGDHCRAYADLRCALALGSDSLGLRNNMAVILAKHGKVESAIKETKQALAPDPNNGAAKANLFNFR